jgi:hypothetical protein
VQARLKIPQWAFAFQWFVDSLAVGIAAGDIHKKRGVAAVGHARNDFHLALLQQLNEIVLGN